MLPKKMFISCSIDNECQVHQRNALNSSKHAEDATASRFRQFRCSRKAKGCENLALLAGRKLVVELLPGDLLKKLEVEVKRLIRLLNHFAVALEFFSLQRIEENHEFLVALKKKYN